LNALFLLYLEIANPTGLRQESFYQTLERRWYNGEKKGDGGSLRWFRVCSLGRKRRNRIMLSTTDFEHYGVPAILHPNCHRRRARCPSRIDLSNGRDSKDWIECYSSGTSVSTILLFYTKAINADE
jgi:hypothetical protein